MRMVVPVLILLVTASAHGAAYEAPLDTRKPCEVSVTTPRVRKVAAGTEISFALSAYTDVEVAVVDAKGKVVRHLAAGLLGPNAPGTAEEECA